jgi:FAD/FMN-containing dehydrogenase
MKRRAFCISAVTVATATASRFAFANTLTKIGADVPAIGSDGRQIVLARSDLEQLRGTIRGSMLLPGNEGYDQARKLWNGSFDRRPAVIVRCAGAADVIETVKFAASNRLLLAVRCGGHSMSGQSACEGGLMLDLSTMRGVRVDPQRQVAYVEGGSLLGELDREAQSFGLATTAGTVSHTGVAGLTLGGGFGRLSRRYALSCDNLTSVDIIPANGQFTVANPKQNPELLWGVRGGGGNFGVVTSFEYQLHPTPPTMIGGLLIYPFSQARELLKFYAEFAHAAPDELWIEPKLVPTPDGSRVVIFDVCYSGETHKAEAALRPLREFRKPIQDTVGPAKYVDLQSSSDETFAYGRCYYVKQGFLQRIESDLVDAIVEHFERTPSKSVAAFLHMGGAQSRVAPGATAFPHRHANYGILLATQWEDRSQSVAHIDAARSSWKVIEPHTRGFYTNDMTLDHSQQTVNENYGANFARLVALKRKYDPQNLFRLNANVPPNA